MTLQILTDTKQYIRYDQGYNARKVNCCCVYSAYILKPVLSGQNLLTRIDSSVFVYSIRAG